MITSDSLQIVFSDSGAGGLKQAVRATGRKLKHCIMPRIECAQVGPIDLLNTPTERVDWIRDNIPDLYSVLMYGENNADAGTELAERWQSDIDTILSWDGTATIWFSKYDMQDMSILLALGQIMPNFCDANLIDVSAIQFEDRRVLATGECNPEQLLKAERSSRRLKPDEIIQLNTTFKRLQQTSLGLRVFSNREISEVSYNKQDEFILRHAAKGWRKASIVFADIFNEGREEGVRDREYLFLLSRLHHLTRTGQLERRDESPLPLFEDSPLMGEIRQSSS